MALIYESPDFFRVVRKTIEPVAPDKFDRLYGAVARVVESKPETFWGNPLRIGTRTVRQSSSDIVEEVCGPNRTKGGHLLDIRLLPETSLPNMNVGAVAIAGVDQIATKTIEEMMEEGSLDRNPTMQNLGLALGRGRITDLWLMSRDGANGWITEYDSNRPIHEHELFKLTKDIEEAI